MSVTGKTPGEEAIDRLPRGAVKAFGARFRGEVILPTDEGYEEARHVWNGMIEKYPAIVARCAGIADVVAAVNFGRENDLHVAVRGGGHNVAGTAIVDGGGRGRPGGDGLLAPAEPHMVSFEASWEDPADDDANVAWAREGIAEIRELTDAAGGYGNFPGFHEDPAHAVYGENYDRLVEVKTTYDLENRFRSNLNVEPRPSR